LLRLVASGGRSDTIPPSNGPRPIRPRTAYNSTELVKTGAMDAAARSANRNFVGRSREIDVLRDAIESVAGGRGAVVLFAGEPGIGKSTLARIGAALAAERGVSVCWGFAWEAGGAPAYWPWTQLLRSLAADRDVPAQQLSALARILPETAADAAQESALLPDQARFRLLEAVRGLLSSLASTTPLMLVLEDLHAADKDSLYLLHYVARHAASLPLLIVGTYREVEARTSAETDALWRTARDATVLRLASLDEQDVRHFLAARQGNEPDDASVRQLLQTTAGNPLFLTELVDWLARDGDAGADDRPLPVNVQQVIRQQLALLPAATADALGTAAVFGREFGAAQLAELMQRPEIELLQALAPALDAGIIRTLADGGYRFGHTLYRDVLYQDLGASRRARLHLAVAALLQAKIDAGDVDSWASLATHLQRAGPDHRLAAIAALRRAAARAQERLAFDDAAALLQRALVAFGEGPRYEPRDRCLLLRDCAAALLAAGEIEAGQKHCHDAFAIARTLDDPSLMAEVALTWGSAIVVARVDRALVAALEECLTLLPATDAATRARVQARLAGALQPAQDPSVPMAMARDAIALARRSGDADVLYTVLRFAISALMDFAPAGERIELNREFGGMAANKRDIPQQFRSNLLMAIDASESGERSLLDAAVDACDRLADSIGLPHYQWRAASARAMQAMIDGEFERATRLLDRAQELAERAEDLQAKVTLSIQRFALLVEWDSPQAMPLEQIEAQLQAAYAGGIRDAEFFVSPFIAMYKQGDDLRFAGEFVSNTPLVERTFAGGDRYSLTGLGLMALKAGDRQLAERCYDALLDYRNGCATLGLMGSCWCGPVAHWLGVIAEGLDRFDAAHSHFEDALSIATRMGGRPYIARIHAGAAELARRTGDERGAGRHAAAAERLMSELGLRRVRGVPSAASPAAEPAVATAAARFSMQRQGDIWNVEHGGKTATMRDSKGLQMLARLVMRPDTDIHVLDLASSRNVADGGDAGPMLDDQARNEYRRRVEELREELDEAESLADEGRAEALRSELDFISRELSRAFGLGGRRRAAGDATERARVNVRRRIKDAVERIAEQLPEAGRYLENTVKTGRYCRYTPM